MPIRVTMTQRKAVLHLRRVFPESMTFGSGQGRMNVALRALMVRCPGVLNRIVTDGAERWSMTDAGRLALLDI